MLFDYTAELSAPLKNKIVYDPSKDRLKTSLRRFKCIKAERFEVVSPSRKLRLLFRLSDGLLYGLEYAGFSRNFSIQGKINLPYAVDGAVHAVHPGEDVWSYCKYLDFLSDGVVFDSQTNCAAFGKVEGDCAFYRVCANMYVSLSPEGGLVGIIVKLQ